MPKCPKWPKAKKDQMPKLPKCRNAKMPRCPNAQMLKCPNVQISNAPMPKMPNGPVRRLLFLGMCRVPGVWPANFRISEDLENVENVKNAKTHFCDIFFRGGCSLNDEIIDSFATIWIPWIPDGFRMDSGRFYGKYMDSVDSGDD